MNLTKQVIGTRHFGNTVDITDPCYNKDVWCRLNNVEIQEGDYQCAVWKTDGSDGWGERVARIGIYLDTMFNTIEAECRLKECLSEIGVDAGLAGFFENKPDFTDEEWSDLCDFMYDSNASNAYLTDLGFWSSSGYGDGGYNVFAYKNGEGTIIGLEIVFIFDEDEDEYDEEFDEEDSKFEIYWDDLSTKC